MPSPVHKGCSHDDCRNQEEDVDILAGYAGLSILHQEYDASEAELDSKTLPSALLALTLSFTLVKNVPVSSAETRQVMGANEVAYVKATLPLSAQFHAVILRPKCERTFFFFSLGPLSSF